MILANWAQSVLSYGMADTINLATTAIFLLSGYLLGSISSAIVVSKLFGLADPRQIGSGNPGATNVLRYAGKKIAIITLAGDALKGVVPIKISLIWGVGLEVATLVGFSAFLGHLFPVFHDFKGGKGVATFLGVTSALYWHIGAGFIASWVFVALIFRYSSLSALLSCLIALALVWKGSQSAIIVSCYLMMVVFIYIKHRENIKNLIAGKEKKIGN